MSHFSTACSAIAAGIALFAAFPDALPQGSLIDTVAADRARGAAAHATAPHSG